MLSPHAEEINAGFWRKRLQAATAYRERVVRYSNSYRMVFGEADLLPGLVIDRYGDHFVMQTLDQGMDLAKESIGSCLEDMFRPASIVLRNDVAVRKHEDLPVEKRMLSGSEPARVAVQMNGLNFEVDLLGGQKTGVYLDQRENYVAAAAHARGRALDCFTSSGGFALHLAGRCDSVVAVDSSAVSIEAAARNAALNGIDNIDFREADVFEFLTASGSAAFDTIVLDPPAFAKSRSGIDGAARGYKEINLRALRMLQPGGVLVTCSCSHHVSEAMLLEIVAAAALDTGRTLRVVERRTQAADHPILLTVPETLYLKCLIMEVV